MAAIALCLEFQVRKQHQSFPTSSTFWKHGSIWWDYGHQERATLETSDTAALTQRSTPFFLPQLPKVLLNVQLQNPLFQPRSGLFLF